MTHQAYWPGTRIPKSHGNAFDLSICPGELARECRLSQIKAEAGLRGAQVSQARQVLVYVRAVASTPRPLPSRPT